MAKIKSAKQSEWKLLLSAEFYLGFECMSIWQKTKQVKILSFQKTTSGFSKTQRHCQIRTPHINNQSSDT